MKTLIKAGTILSLLTISGLAMADIQLKTTAEIDVTTVNQQGVKTVQRKPATKVVPGQEVIYTIIAKNTGKQAAEKVVVKNPVPSNTVYVDGSVFGKNTEISFSTDGGKTYAQAGKLQVRDADGKLHPATAKDYTNIRWVFRIKLKPGASAQVGYRVRLK